jgi:lambda repressor-like predicted transcriptional regulator
MTLTALHPEDVKAALRKQFGSVRAFEIDSALPEKSVTDLLRGRTSQRVSDAVERALGIVSISEHSDSSDNSTSKSAVHRKIGKAA